MLETVFYPSYQSTIIHCFSSPVWEDWVPKHSFNKLPKPTTWCDRQHGSKCPCYILQHTPPAFFQHVITLFHLPTQSSSQLQMALHFLVSDPLRWDLRRLARPPVFSSALRNDWQVPSSNTTPLTFCWVGEHSRSRASRCTLRGVTSLVPLDQTDVRRTWRSGKVVRLTLQVGVNHNN